MDPHIVIIGSSNTDMVIQAEHLPAPGETILGGRFFMNPGGKGANQAVAAARLGGRVLFIAKTGNDVFGERSLQLFRQEGINTDFLLSDPENPSGIALITVDRNGENSIVVASGANAGLCIPDLLPALEWIETSALILMQLEIPLEVVQYVAEIAAPRGGRIVLNPAPARDLEDRLLKQVSIITPNIREAEMLTGLPIRNLESAIQAARIIHERGVETVIITMGKEGVLLLLEDVPLHVPGLRVKAVDSTAAGDVFNGALVVALAEGRSMEESVGFANRAAAISVTRPGAQSAAPFRKELDSPEFSEKAQDGGW